MVPFFKFLIRFHKYQFRAKTVTQYNVGHRFFKYFQPEFNQKSLYLLMLKGFSNYL